MRRSKRKMKTGRRGVEAIFTSTTGGRDRIIYLGASGILAGVVLWTVAFVGEDFPTPFTISTLNDYVWLALVSFGLLFVICGAGVCLVFSTLNLNRARVEPDGSLDSPDSLLLDPTSVVSRRGIVAFIQSLVSVVLYAGLVQEYKSSVGMQAWLRSFFPVGQYAMSPQAVLVFSALGGLVVIQFLPGRILSDGTPRHQGSEP